MYVLAGEDGKDTNLQIWNFVMGKTSKNHKPQMFIEIHSWKYQDQYIKNEKLLSYIKIQHVYVEFYGEVMGIFKDRQE